MTGSPTLLLDRQAWLHSGKSFVAAILALYIALAADLPRPYWAMATAYIVMQPVLGGTHARGIYRIVGTFLGSAAVVVLVPNMLHVPEVLSFAMSLWLAVCIFVSLLHRGPASYTFMLAGYTAAFVGFPTVVQPDTIFDTALARTEEIVLGSLCAVVIGAVVFPVSIKTQIVPRVQALMKDARSWFVQVLEQRGSPGELRRRLAMDLSQLDLVIPFTKRDDPRHGALADWLAELRARLLGMLPVLAAVEDRLAELGAAAQDAGLRRLLDELRDWTGGDAPPARDGVDALLRRIDALRSPLGDDGQALLRNSLLLRLRELVELWFDCRHLQRALVDGAPPPPSAFGIDLRRLVHIGNRHIDWSMVAFSALAAGATMFAFCLIWIGLGWPDGATGAMMAGVSAAFFAAQDDPAPSIVLFLNWIVLATLVAGVYLFGFLPAIHDFGLLVLVMATVLLPAGLMALRPQLFLPGMVLVTNFASLLAIQNHYEADFTRYVNSSLSTVIGMLFALVVTRLFRSIGAEWSAQRLVREGWRLLAEAAEGSGVRDRERFTIRMLDLLGLLAPRLASLRAGEDIAGVDLLDEIRQGLNILNLRRARHELPEADAGMLNRLLHAVGAHYRALERAGRPLPAPPPLRLALEDSLARLRTLPPGAARDEALLGLIGLRQGLFAGHPLQRSLRIDPASPAGPAPEGDGVSAA